MFVSPVRAQDQATFKKALAELEMRNSQISYINASHRTDSQAGFALETNLSKSATNEQLDSIALHGKLPAMRMLAYYTLLWFRKGKYCADLMPKMLSDDGKVTMAASGDGKTTTVNRFVAIQSSIKKGLFTAQHIDKLDSMFISYPDIRTKGYYAEALKRCKGVPKYYQDIHRQGKNSCNTRSCLFYVPSNKGIFHGTGSKARRRGGA